MVYCRGLFTQRTYSAWIFAQKQGTSMKLFILDTTLHFERFLQLTFNMNRVSSGICVALKFRCCCEQLKSKYSSANLFFFFVSTHRSDDRGLRLHCQTTVADHRFTLCVLRPCQNVHVCRNPIHLDSL